MAGIKTTVPVQEIDGFTKSPSTEEMLAEAEKIWAYNRAHPEEVRATLQRVQDSAPLFGDVDGVAYQRQIRDEWEDRLVQMGLSDITD